MDKPFWIIGYVDSYKSVHAREISERESVYGSSNHTNEERLSGRPFRWGVISQEFFDVRTGYENPDERIERVLRFQNQKRMSNDSNS